jgi:hypothetical protein
VAACLYRLLLLHRKHHLHKYQILSSSFTFSPHYQRHLPSKTNGPSKYCIIHSPAFIKTLVERDEGQLRHQRVSSPVQIFSSYSPSSCNLLGLASGNPLFNLWPFESVAGMDRAVVVGVGARRMKEGTARVRASMESKASKKLIRRLGRSMVSMV